MKKKQAKRMSYSPDHGQVKLYSFTLIELLVVIAIIAILAAMLMPALQKARETAKSITCSSNLKQVSMSFQNYAMDFKGFAPAHHYGKFKGGSNSDRLTWVTFLRDQLKYIPLDYHKGIPNGSGTPTPKSLLYCPSGRELREVHDISTHYGINNQITTPKAGGGYYKAYATRADRGAGKKAWSMDKLGVYLKLETLDRPARIAQIGDAAQQDYWIARNTEDLEEFDAFRHNDGINLAFWDGHSEHAARLKFAVLPKTNTTWDNANWWRWPWW